MRLTRPGETTRNGLPGKWRRNRSATRGTSGFIGDPPGRSLSRDARREKGSDPEAELLADLGGLAFGRSDDAGLEPRRQVVRVAEAPEGQDPAVLAVVAFEDDPLPAGLADGLNGDGRQKMDDGVERLGDAHVLRQVGDDEPRHPAQRLDDLGLVPRAGPVEVEDKRGVAAAPEGLLDGGQDVLALGGEAAEDQDRVEGYRKDVGARPLVVEEQADELGGRQAVDGEDGL